jgi:hypothetical protein
LREGREEDVDLVIDLGGGKATGIEIGDEGGEEVEEDFWVLEVDGGEGGELTIDGGLDETRGEGGRLGGGGVDEGSDIADRAEEFDSV